MGVWAFLFKEFIMATERYKHEKDRIKRWIKNAETRGYNIDEELKTAISNNEYSIQKLISLTPDRLYEHATKSYGEVTKTGKQARTIDRSLSAKKGVQTKIEASYSNINTQEEVPQKEAYEGIDYTITDEEYILKDWLIKREKQDEIDKKNAIGFDEAEMVYQAITNEASKFDMPGNLYVRKLLENEEKKYGSDAVKKALANMSEEEVIKIQRALLYISASDDSLITVGTYKQRAANNKEVYTTLKGFAEAIRGSISTIDEAKEIGNINDSMNY